MGDWFRNTHWNDDIAARFEAALGRSRKKAQYLVLQGFTLLSVRPEIAAELLRRAILLDEPDQTARAALYLGTALGRLGDLDGAVAALEAAIKAEARHPSHRTAARLDQALLIALARRDDMYDLALQRLAGEVALPLEDQLLTASIADTLIRGERGENVTDKAATLLAALADAEDRSGELPECLSMEMLRARLTALASS